MKCLLLCMLERWKAAGVGEAYCHILILLQYLPFGMKDLSLEKKAVNPVVLRAPEMTYFSQGGGTKNKTCPGGEAGHSAL